MSWLPLEGGQQHESHCAVFFPVGGVGGEVPGVLPVIGRETGPGNREVGFQVAPDVIGVVSERGTIDHPDYDGATTKDIFFLLKTGEVLMINCTDYSNKDNEAGDEDLFRIGLWTKELNEWLTNI